MSGASPEPPIEAEAGDPGRGSSCPACGKAVDPLRAGHVAFLGGQFRYFCDSACKKAHLRSPASPAGVDPVPPSEVETAEPPPVTAVTPAAPAEPVAFAPEDRAPDDSPQELRAPTGGQDAARKARATSWADAASMAGIGAGMLAAGVALVGDAAREARLPLAALAAVAIAAQASRARRDPADVHPWVTLAPVLGALVAAGWAKWADDPAALSLASFSGLASAAVLGVNVMVGRAAATSNGTRLRAAEALDCDVRVVRRGEVTRVASFDVRSGEQVVVEAGETVGVDGLVRAGDATVCPWPGAPIEVKRREGQAVIAGARIVSGQLHMTATRAAADRAWVRLAGSSSLRVDVAAPLLRMARAVVERGVLGAFLVALIGALALHESGPFALATACAIALALTAKGSIAAAALQHAQGQQSALSHGIVYGDAASFETAGKVDVAVLCSRGTVLTGEPEIVALEAFGSLEVSKVLGFAAGAEAGSTHPFAAAILGAARTRGDLAENVRSPLIHPGLGVTALSSTGERLVVGSRAMLLEERVSVAIADARVSELEGQGRSVLLVALSGKLIGLIALQDGLRSGARAAVQRLLDARIEPVLLSGEARETCETLGRALDIEHIRPEVLPADRGGQVKALQEGGHLVAVLGHPATDDGALGAASVSVALGAAGLAPGEWSIALASDDVRDAARALSIAREVRERSRISLAVGLAPGALAALAVGCGAAPLGLGPVGFAVGALAAVVYAKD